MAEPAGPTKPHVPPPPPFVPCPAGADGAAKKPVKQGLGSGAVKWCREAPVAKDARPTAPKDQPDPGKSVPAADLQDASPVVAPHGSVTNSWHATNHAAPESNAPPKGSAPPGIYNRTQGEVRVEIKAGPVVVAPYAGYAMNLDPTKGAPAAESVERVGVKVQVGPASVRAEGAVRHQGSTPATPVNFVDGDFVGEYNPSGRVGPVTQMGMEASALVRLSPDATKRKVAGSANFVVSVAPRPGAKFTASTGVGGADYYAQQRHDLYVNIGTLGAEKKVGPVTLGGDVAARATFSTDKPHDRVVEVRTMPLKAKVEF